MNLDNLAGAGLKNNAADLKNKSAADLYRLLIALTGVRTDAYAALDYYFENYNDGKPFILAGHPQGSAVIEIILSEYTSAHPEHLQKMISAYAIGFPNINLRENAIARSNAFLGHEVACDEDPRLSSAKTE